MEKRLILVTGGARSGKSNFAERLLALCDGTKGYIATAVNDDAEMGRRIKRHQERRQQSWRTFEVPQRLAERLPQILTAVDAALIDCLTVYLSNWLFFHRSLPEDMAAERALAEVDSLLAAAAASGKTVIFVTNEVGGGIVPMEKLSRFYRDLSGLMNQRVAAAADAVYLSVAGITLEIKSRQVLLPEAER